MYGYGTKEHRSQCMDTERRSPGLNVPVCIQSQGKLSSMYGYVTEEHRAQCMVRNQGPQSSMYVYETDDHKV